MTKTREQTTTNASGDGPPATTQPAGVAGYLSRALRLLPSALASRTTATPQGGAAGTKPPRSQWNRFFFAMLAYLIGSIVLEYVLLLANTFFKLHLERAQNLFPTSWPFVGSMSRYSLIYVLLLAALIWVLYRTNIMPRDMFGARAAQQQRGNAQGTNASSTTTATSAASRRHSARRQSALVSTVPAPHRKTSGQRAAAATSARSSASTVATPSSGDHDEAYLRARAIQRLRRRKH